MEGDEKLVEAVRGFPCLWQVRTKTYKDLTAKENMWKLVAEQVSVAYTVNKIVILFKKHMIKCIGCGYYSCVPKEVEICQGIEENQGIL